MTVVSTPTVVTLIAPQAALASDPVTLVATVAAVGGGYAPSGTVEFVDNGSDLGTATLNSVGTATLTLPPLSIGTYSLTATYEPSADSPYAEGQTASPSSLQVIASPTSISLSAPGVAWSAGPLTIMAIVGGGAGLSGTVQFVDGDIPLGSAPIGPGGTATLTLASLAIGTHRVTAAFQPAAGSPFAAGQTAGASTIQVVANPTIPIATQTSLTVTQPPLGPSARTSIKTGGRIIRLVFGAGVSSSMTTPPSGSIELLVGGKVAGISAIDAAGQATFRLAGREAFGKSVAAVYLGGANGLTPLLASQSAAFTPRRGRILAQPATAVGSARPSPAHPAPLHRDLSRGRLAPGPAVAEGR